MSAAMARLRARFAQFDEMFRERSLRERAILGGGLAFSDGRLFVTTGFADVLALNAKSGETVWR